jgi:type II secretory pathway component PulJ
MNSKSESNFYVYQYLREDGTPYYIGKGSGRRHLSRDRVVSPPTDKNRIQIIKDNLNEADAFTLETQLIIQYGRKDIGTGILRNKTNGGEGASGAKRTEEQLVNYRGKEHSAETRKRRSESMKKYKRTEEHQQNINKSLQGREPTWTGRTHNEETKAKLRALYLGKKRKPMSVESKAKLSETMKQVRANKHWSPKGQEI